MGFFKFKSICSLYTVVIFLFAGGAFGAVPILPHGLVMEDGFKPGFGAPVGKIRMVQGKVIIIHAKMMKGYWATKGLSLYKGDTIFTQKKSRINFRMNDKSIITLSSNTKLVINKSIYDKKQKRRSSFLGLSLGKARFLVTKLFSFKRSEFRVKTVTAVCGVRGSEFIVVASSELTEVTALEDTELEVMSLAAPEMPLTIITDFERTGVALGKPPYEPELVPPQEIENLKKIFTGAPEGSMQGKEKEVQKEETEETDTDEDESAEGDAEEGDTEEGDTKESESAEDDTGQTDTEEGESDEADTEQADAEEGESGEGETEQADTAESESTEDETEQADTAESEPSEDDSQQTDTVESGSTEDDAEQTDNAETGLEEGVTGEPDTGISESSENGTVVGDTEEGSLAAEGTAEDNDASGMAGVGETTETKAVNGIVGVGDIAEDGVGESGAIGDDAAVEMPEAGGVAAEGAELDDVAEVAGAETDVTVDDTEIYVPADVLVGPEVTTALDDPVIETEAIAPDWTPEPEIEDQVAEEQLEEDMAIPEFPSVPE